MIGAAGCPAVLCPNRTAREEHTRLLEPILLCAHRRRPVEADRVMETDKCN